MTYINLPLVEFRFEDTFLCEPSDVDFQAWIGGIATVSSTEVYCEYPTTEPIGLINPDITPISTPEDVYGAVVNLAVHFDLEDTNDESSQSVMVMVFDDSGTYVHLPFVGAAGATPNKQLTDLPVGSYQVWVKPEGYLAKRVAMNLGLGPNIVTFTDGFVGGDIIEQNSFNVVNSIDYSGFVSEYGSTDYVFSDLNKSGMVNGLDYSIFVGNYLLQGDSYE
jgi:hypothetical protein